MSHTVWEDDGHLGINGGRCSEQPRHGYWYPLAYSREVRAVDLWSFFGGGGQKWLRATVLVWMLFAPTGCDNNRIAAPPGADAQVAQTDTSAREGQGVTASFAHINRVDVVLSATGKYSPGSPVTLSSHVTGIRGSTSSRLRIRADQSPSGRVAAYIEEVQIRSISPGAEVDQNQVVTFAEPGYYHVMASVNSLDGSEVRDDRQLGAPGSEVVTGNLWILIDDLGGRVDTEYDQAIVKDTTRYLTNGSIGAFRSRTVQTAASPARDGSRSAIAVSPVAAVNPTSSAMTFSGRITYLRSDGFGNSAIEGVPSVRVTGYCSTVAGVPLSGFDVGADAQGAFAVSCSDDAFSINVTATLSSSTLQVNNYNNAFSGAVGWISVWDFGAQVPLAVNNNAAAQVFINHQRYNVVAAGMFNRARGPVTYRVSDGPALATNYDSPGDYVRIGPNMAWGRNGIVNVVHEYGHAFHFVAIDPWVALSFGCGSPTHYPEVPYNTSCAYVEGFADFFAARIINSADGSASNGDGLSQFLLEMNPYRSNGNGLIIEATFAALLLDLVDSSADDDGIAGDDDILSISLYDLSQIMRQCRMSSPSTALLTHSDQFVYCAAGSVAERAFAPSLASWGVYGGLTYDAPTARPPQSVFRALWRYNFYNL